MSKNNMMTPIIAGTAVSMAVGTAAYVMSSKSMKSKRRTIKKNAGKMVRAMGDIADNLSYMVR
ncbi:MAG: hypothetical protein RR263_01865 [Oscillospiraceae bacterium]